VTPQEFSACLRREVIDQNVKVYDRLLTAPPADVRDDRWRAVAAAYTTMNKEQQTAVRTLVRRVMIDTVSTLLGILDGSSLLDRHREDFRLTYGKDRTTLNGDLQDYFLADVEENP
jgi:hypothetical protein